MGELIGSRPLRGAACALLTAACGGALRTVPTGTRGAAASPTVVESPPPPARVETVPPDPGEPCAWLDGRWEWTGRTWEWAPGAWVVAEHECRYAPPEATWVAAGERGLLFYLPGRWYRGDGRPCPEPRTCGPR